MYTVLIDCIVLTQSSMSSRKIRNSTKQFFEIKLFGDSTNLTQQNTNELQVVDTEQKKVLEQKNFRKTNEIYRLYECLQERATRNHETDRQVIKMCTRNFHTRKLTDRSYKNRCPDFTIKRKTVRRPCHGFKNMSSLEASPESSRIQEVISSCRREGSPKSPVNHGLQIFQYFCHKLDKDFEKKSCFISKLPESNSSD